MPLSVSEITSKIHTYDKIPLKSKSKEHIYGITRVVLYPKPIK